jgi:formiminotetrahydrofolate cyclodeaminase
LTRDAERPLAELLDALAERSPAPGAGVAAAWAGALAAALLEMVAAFADDEAAGARAPALRAGLLEAGEDDVRSYAPVLDALRLPAGDPSRERRVQEALSTASEAPLAIVRASAEVTDLAMEVWARSKPALRGDAAAAVLIAESAARSAARLVEINLHGRRGDPRPAEVAELSSRAARARDQVLADTTS